MDIKDCCKIGATGLSGIFSGGALYINMAGHPATQTLDTVNRRKVWKHSYIRGRNMLAPLVGLGALAGAGAYYLDDGSDCRYLWLVGSGIFLCVWPWTLIVMKPDINKNVKDDVIDTAGETWVCNHIHRWNRQHMVRSFLGSTAFGIFLYALSRK